ncbi:Macrolide export ATP-binding/permease protein MacB [Lacunisphaera limnophila]|uniref:Macrolide export ATP-binding/permease protein MacB n=1 Tax=Lacunisphaera limnophila TaxID=1838286 RepID=A0A1D8AZ74_9BACT|nr:ABC transporter permease [Lacunisphaera limnophila]AOS46189.1 Macrolide export ATP-binding/permease protein MacB [Lacunisphaera limnophila]
MPPLLRFALRQLLKNPGFTATVTLVLALGIGATTAIFSVVHAVLLNPFPYQDGNQILFVGSSRLDQPGSQMPVAYPDYLEWRQQVKTVEHLGFASGSAVTLTGIPEPAVLRNGAISAAVWPLLGLPPVLGRVFTEAEDAVGAAPVAVLSHATWQRRFQGDPGVLGRLIILDGKSYTVIGVMPPVFKFWAADVWTPVGLQADTDIMRSRLMRMDTWVVTRARPGLGKDDVQTELDLLARQLALQFPETNKDVGVAIRFLAESVAGPFRDPLLGLLFAVACVLLIACANVANLLLARTSARRREYAVRAALGASRGQLLRQTLVESLPLALLGGGAGLVVAVWGLDGLLAILPQDAVPAEAQIRVNGPVMLFSLAVTLGTLLLFALFPALEGSRAAVSPALSEGSRGTASRATGRIRAGLIIAEVALSLMLLVGAGLLIRSLQQISAVDVGFDRHNLLAIPLQLPEARYAGSEQATTFFEDAVTRLQDLPAIAAVAATTNAPFIGGSGMPLAVEGRAYQDLNEIRGVQFSLVTRDYFRAQGLPLRRGRVFDDTDRAGSQPVIILNEAAAKEFLPGVDPLGKRVMLGAPEHLLTPGMLPPGFDTFQWATVVGVVRDARHFGQAGDPPPAAFIPVRQGWDYPQMRRFMILLIRTHGEPTAAVPVLREILKSLDRNLPVERISPMDSLISDTLQGTRFNTVLLGLFAGVALALSAVGIYGVVAWNVTQRTREIGVRLALGANRGNVLRLVVGQSMRVVGVGIVLGVAGAIAVAHVMRSTLFGISTFDPVTFCAVVSLLAAAALLACWLPARRATKVDPMVALRSE